MRFSRNQLFEIGRSFFSETTRRRKTGKVAFNSLGCLPGTEPTKCGKTHPSGEGRAKNSAKNARFFNIFRKNRAILSFFKNIPFLSVQYLNEVILDKMH